MVHRPSLLSIPLIGLFLGLTLVALVPLGASAQQADHPLADRIRQAALRQLADQFPTSARRFEIRVDQIQSERHTADSVRIVLGSASRVPRARHQVDLEVRVSDRADDRARGSSWRAAGWALLYVSHYDSVLVAGEHLSGGTAVSSDVLDAAWMEVTEARGLPLTTEAYRRAREEDRTILKRSVREGSLLQESDLRGAFAADVGDPLTLRYERGPVRATLDCKAREPGAQGEVIRVYCGSTRSMYRARLTDAGSARWLNTIR